MIERRALERIEINQAAMLRRETQPSRAIKKSMLPVEIFPPPGVPGHRGAL
jgi:hypothetical protein